jgi:MoaA/NifB/PqqE/SkfB family radical SAM enzyme
MVQLRARRKIRSFYRRLRELRMIAGGLLSTGHPILAHLIPIRRCNLSCTYCNEFDDFSKPVAVPVLARRVDLLAKLGTSVITISGGEPLLHPQLEDLIRHIRSRGLIAGMITNGYLLTPDRIKKLNAAGLDHLQISIDNVMPDETSKKSLKVLDQKLVMLARYADFGVNINSVLGSPVRQPDDALTVAKRAKALGFTSTVGILHDHSGQLLPLSETQQCIYLQILDLEKRSYSRFFGHFQHQVAHGQAREWRCRAGSRYLYICEDGLVHYCSQQRGFPGVPLEDYGPEQLRYEYLTQKSCAPRCTVSCVQVIGLFDNWRDPQTQPAFLPSSESLVQIATSATDRG